MIRELSVVQNILLVFSYNNLKKKKVFFVQDIEIGDRQTAVKLKTSTIILKRMRAFVLIALSGNDGTGDSARRIARAFAARIHKVWV